MSASVGQHWPLKGPDRLLGLEALDGMHAAAVGMLGKTGMLVEHADVRAAIARREGFSLVDGRVRIAHARIEAFVAHLRTQAAPPPARDPGARLTLGVDTRASHLVERDGRTLRPMTRQDVVDSAKLVAMLADRGVSGSTTGVPSDVPAPLIPLEQFMIAAEYSREGGATNDVTDVYTTGVIREMNRVYGRGFGRSVWNPSPLILGGSELDVLWHYRAEVEDVYVGSMPSMGVTGPCDPLGVFAVSVAECLGGAVILSELLPRARIVIGPHPEPADMATGVMVFGTPEWELLDLMHRDVHGYYGLRSDQKLIHTTASLPGVQAAADHSGSMMLGAAYGYTHFSPGGMLALDEVYSPAMLVLDAEMLGHTGRVLRGAWSGAGLDLAGLADVVAEVVAEGEVFAGHATTVANMREQYHRPKTLKRLNRIQWIEAGRPDEVRTAQAEAERLVAAFDYEPPGDTLRALRAIYEAAKKKLI